MLASESKLAANNLKCIAAVLRGLKIIRENGGYGSLEIKVKDGMALHLKSSVDEQVEGA
jgi:hypothetical protein